MKKFMIAIGLCLLLSCVTLSSAFYNVGKAADEVHFALHSISNDPCDKLDSIWDNSKGPYGGDRKNVVIDYHNPNILFVDCCDNSGVWISKTSGEPTGDPYNPAWQHTKLDRGYAQIKGTYDNDNTYVFSTISRENPNIYRLKYSKSEDPQEKEWEKIGFADDLGDILGTFIYSDPYNQERVFISVNDLSQRETRVFYSIQFGESESWQEILFDTSTFPIESYDEDIGVYIAEFGFDSTNENKFYMSVGYGKNNQLTSAIVSYHLDEGWSLISEELPGLITSFCLADNNNRIYATIVKSDDHAFVVGEKEALGDYTWEYRDIKLENGTLIPSSQISSIRGIKVSPYDSSTLFVALLSSSNDTMMDFDIRGLYKSENKGETWRKVASADNRYMTYLKRNSIFFDPHYPQIMYAGMTNFDSIRKSIDGGETWYPITEGLNGINVFGVAITNDRIYGVVQSAVAINEDNLETNAWEHRQLASPDDGRVTANLYGGVEVDPFSENIVLIGAGHKSTTLSHNGGIYRNENYGYTDSPLEWERVLYDSDSDDGLSNPQIMDIFFSETTPGLVFATAMINKATGVGERGVYISQDHGVNWDWIYKKSDMYYVVQDPYDPIYYAVGEGEKGGGKVIKITIDPTLKIEESKSISIPGQNDYFYCIDIQRGLSEEDACAFIGTQNGKILKISLLDLREFNFKKGKQITSPSNEPQSIIQIIFNKILAYLNLIDTDTVESSSNQYYEFDTGTSTVVAVDPNNPNIVYAGLLNGGIFRSIDSGETWQDYSQGLTSSAIDIYELKFSPDGKRLFAGTLGAIAVIDVE